MKAALSIDSKTLHTPFFVLNSIQHKIYFSLSTFLQSPSVDKLPRKCKYCKAYPFSANFKHEENVKECQLCLSINDHPMRHDLYQNQSQQYPSFVNSSYLALNDQQHAKTVRVLFLIDLAMSSQFIQMSLEAMKLTVPSLPIPACFMIVVGGKLGVIGWNEQIEITYLNQDICLKDLIEQNSCIMVESFFAALSEAISDLQTVNSKNNLYEMPRIMLQQIYRDYVKHNILQFNILIWIGKLYTTIVIPPSYLYSIALLEPQKDIKAEYIYRMQEQLNELYIISGRDKASRMYYKLYQIVSAYHLGCIIEGQVAVHTDHKYSGSITRHPLSLINSYTPYLQVRLVNNTLHKIQIVVSYYSVEEAKSYVLVINCLAKVYRNDMFIQRAIVISKHLESILDQLRSKQTQKVKGLQFNSIRKAIQNIKGMYENSSQRHQLVLDHISDYFREFMKHPVKTWLPFSMLMQKQVVFLFYPLIGQQGIIHFYYGCSGQEEQEIQEMNQLLGIHYATKYQKTPIFYQICINEQNTVSVVK